MDKTQTEALIKWSTTMVESIEEINTGLNTLKILLNVVHTYRVASTTYKHILMR